MAYSQKKRNNDLISFISVYPQISFHVMCNRYVSTSSNLAIKIAANFKIIIRMDIYMRCDRFFCYSQAQPF